MRKYWLKQPSADQSTFVKTAQYRELSQTKPLNALDLYQSNINGLQPDVVEERIETHGLNEIFHQKKENVFFTLLSYFQNPFIILLCLLDIISFVSADYGGVVVITSMILLSILVTFIQENRSKSAAQKLQSLVTNKIYVTRYVEKELQEEADSNTQDNDKVYQSEKIELPFSQLVPGDIIHLSAGDMVPADCKIITAKDLFISQASLTGESVPVEKVAFVETATNNSILQARNLCFMGSNVVSGTAMAMIFATGNETYFGRIAHSLQKEKTNSSFDTGIRNYSWLIIKLMLIMLPFVFLANGFLKGDWLAAFLFAVAVAVGMTSEMLPMVITVNLARGAMAMSKRKVIVKKLTAIQNFGAMNMLCTDKTGTLTQDKVVLERYIDVFNEPNQKVFLLTYLNSYYQTGLNSLLDRAVLDHQQIYTEEFNLQEMKKIDEIPFDFVRRRMSVVVERSKSQDFLICKGALEEILLVSSQFEAQEKIYPLNQEKRTEFQELVQELNNEGLRVIAVAYKTMAKKETDYSVKDEQELTLIGFVAFLDPPKDTALSSIQALQQLGVQIKVLTGDNEAVTKKICQQVGISANRVVTSNEVDALTDQELADLCDEVSVFAKLTPFQKERIVSALHLNNHVVGFLGDGINDSPALKKADVGISVENAVDIAKESADIILLEKSLSALVDGVREGRKVFGNILKYIKIGASSNFGNVLSVAGASLFLPFLPMLPGQIMLAKLVYDFSQIAVPWDKVDEKFIEKPRRWEISDIKKFMFTFGPVSSLFDYTAFAVLWFLFAYQVPSTQTYFQTGWFILSLISQVTIFLMLRTEQIPFFQSMPSKIVLLSSFLTISFAIWVPNSFLAPYFRLETMPVLYYPFLIAIVCGYVLLSHGLKTRYQAHRVGAKAQ